MTTLATETWTGANGAAWPSQWTTSGSASIQSNAGQLTTTTATYTPTTSAYLSGMASAGDTDVTVDIAFSTIAEQYWYLLVRASTPSGSGIAANGYSVDFYPGNGANSIGVTAFASGNETSLSGDLAAGVWTAGVAKRVRFQAIGNALAVKVWDPASAEPVAWLWQGTSAIQSAATGKLQIVGANGGAASAKTATFDNLTVTNGVATPTGSNALFMGSTAPPSLYVGSTAVSKLYVGSTQVWP